MKNSVVDFAVKWWADRIDGTVKDRSFEERFGKTAKMCILLDDDISFDEKTDFYQEYIEIMERIKESRLEKEYVSKRTRHKFEKYLRHYIETELYKNGHVMLTTDHTGSAFAEFGIACKAAGIDSEKLIVVPNSVEMWVDETSVELRYDEKGSFSLLYSINPPENKPIQLPAKFDKEM